MSSLVASLRTVRDYLVVRTPPHPSDVILCFGSLDERVPVRAAELFHLGLAPLVLVSGAAREAGGPAEARRFADILADRGVPPGRILVEADARNTAENVTRGMALVAERPQDVERVVLVSWPLACRRSTATFARAFPWVRTGTVPSADVPVRRARPGFARTALGELDRVCRYSATGAIAPQVVPPRVSEAASHLRRRLLDAESSARQQHLDGERDQHRQPAGE